MADRKSIITSGAVTYGDQVKWRARGDSILTPREIRDMLHGAYPNGIPYLHIDHLTAARDYLQTAGEGASVARAHYLAGIQVRESGETRDIRLVSVPPGYSHLSERELSTLAPSLPTLTPKELLEQITTAIGNRTIIAR